MCRRLFIICLLVLGEVLVLLGAGISATETPESEGYVVGANQTLASIAADYGITVDALARFNRLDPATQLKAGQVILVPIVVQVAPQLSTTAAPATARTPDGELVTGVVASIHADKADILPKPGTGHPLFSNTPHGTQLLVTGQVGEYYSLLMSDGSTGWIAVSAVTLTNTRMQVQRPTPPVRPELAANAPGVVQTAMEYMGIPYEYGGRLPRSVDCSLLIQTVFARQGIRLPRTAAQQMQVGTPVDVAMLQSGDRLYFANRSGAIIHTALYIGEGRFIHASSNRGQVAIDELANPTYASKYAGARR